MAAVDLSNGRPPRLDRDPAEERWRALVEASSEAVVAIDRRGRILEFNRVAETILGHTRADVLGADLLSLAVPPRLREPALAALARLSAAGGLASRSERFETRALRADGSELPVDVAVVPFRDRDGTAMLLCARDLSTRLDAQSDAAQYRTRVRSLMAELLVAEERERRRLAEDLHDGLSQTIALAQMKLSSLRESRGAEFVATLASIEELVQSADRTARAICFELSPPVLHHLGLAPAVRWLIDNLHERYGLSIDLAEEGPVEPVDETCRVILFRSIRELLINAAKHSGVRDVRLALRREAERLVITVEDDGAGMDPAVAGNKGTGLDSIRERLAHVGGTIRIDSAPGSGTRIRLCVPSASPEPVEPRERP